VLYGAKKKERKRKGEGTRKRQANDDL